MKKLLLLGGGHAHVHVLKTLAEDRLANVEVTLVSPYARQVYSGMLPGWVAGHYAIGQCVIPLPPLCRAARVGFAETACERIDLAARTVHCADGSQHAFDVLSIDTGPVANTAMIPGAANAIAVRPIETFIDAYSGVAREITERRASGKSIDIAFVGAGAAGIELALAMGYAYRDANVNFTLISAANTLPGSVGPRLARVLEERGFRLLTGKMAARIDAHRVHLQDGEVIEADHIFVSTGASAAAWPRLAGLATNDAGFILIDRHLQSISHPGIFAAGDCATMQHAPRPKSGVYAVRAGPPLAENLRRCLNEQPMKDYTPQERSLYLISTGDQYAIASWGDWTWQGKWVWRWKDRIDRAFMAKYALTDS